MIDFLAEGGWGMYPVLVFGAVALGLAAWHAYAPRKDVVPLIVGFGFTTLVAGLLGTVRGLQRATEAAQLANVDERWIWLIGLRESLNCTVLAIVMVILVALIASAGSVRLIRKPSPLGQSLRHPA